MSFKGAVGTDITVDTLCGIMTDTSKGSPLERYATVNSLILKMHGEKCLEFKYDDMITELKKTKWTSSAAEGGEIYSINFAD